MTRFCGACGTARTSETQRFCAGCGVPLDAPAAPAAAPAAAPVAAPVAAPAAAPAGPGPRPDVLAPAALAPTSGPARLGAGKLLGFGALALALVGGGAVAWQVLGPSGGADDPVLAVEQFLDAASSQDAVGALAALNPGEVDGLDQVYEAARARLDEVGVLPAGGEEITDAVSVEFSGLEFDVVERGERLALVMLTGGSYEVTYDPARLPDFARVLRERSQPRTVSGDVVDDLGDYLPDAVRGNDRPDPFLAAVEVDGGWYVSAAATALETAYVWGPEGLRAPDYDALVEPLEPIVAEDPEDVFDGLAASVNSGDYDELLARFPQEQVDVLRPYVRVLEDYLTRVGAGLSIDVADVEVEESEDGDQVRLTLESAEVSATAFDQYDAETGFGSIRGGCLVGADDDGDEESICLGSEVLGWTGIDEFYVLAQRVDGGYQLDPLATVASWSRTALEEGSESTLRDIVDASCREVNYEFSYLDDFDYDWDEGC